MGGEMSWYKCEMGSNYVCERVFIGWGVGNFNF
jgi:hypothetical protein